MFNGHAIPRDRKDITQNLRSAWSGMAPRWNKETLMVTGTRQILAQRENLCNRESATGHPLLFLRARRASPGASRRAREIRLSALTRTARRMRLRDRANHSFCSRGSVSDLIGVDSDDNGIPPGTRQTQASAFALLMLDEADHIAIHVERVISFIAARSRKQKVAAHSKDNLFDSRETNRRRNTTKNRRH